MFPHLFDGQVIALKALPLVPAADDHRNVLLYDFIQRWCFCEADVLLEEIVK